MILIIIVAITVLILLFYNRSQFTSVINIIKYNHSWLYYLILAGLFTGLLLFYYYGYPFFFQDKELVVAFLSTFTVTNIMAIALSWYYFNNTHCWDNEGNKLARELYHFTGEDVGHVILIVLRAIQNIIVVQIIIAGLYSFEPSNYDGFKNVVFLYSLLTALYTFELIMNIFANFIHPVESCIGKMHYLCKTYGVFCDEPALLKQDKMGRKKNRR
jgi:hypothetical protein